MNSLKRTLTFIYQHPLAKRHLFRAYRRFIYWQFRSLFSNVLISVQFIGKTKVLAKKGLTGITGNIYTGLHEFEEMAFLLHVLREADTFFDVGANVGSFTILASGVCQSKTLSFEPVPGTAEILRKNIDLNQLKQKVKIINSAVGYEQTSIKLTSSQDATNHVITTAEMEHDTITVPVVKLDEFKSEFPLLLKIDVEGFEWEVLQGAHELLSQNTLKAIIIELNGSGARYGFDDEKIHIKLMELGFRPYQYEPFTRNLTQLNLYGKFNTIYLRDVFFIIERIRSGKPFEIFSSLI